jgi:hypothetical protein
VSGSFWVRGASIRIGGGGIRRGAG